MLPKTEQKSTERNNFPTRWQTVVFRNWRMVPTARIAATLGCTEADVEREALRMGLRPGKYDPIWEKRGFINIIRNSWYLLPYSQIETLLGVSEEQLDFWLAKEDFLWVKLGKTKPECPEVKYSPLSDEQIKETEEIAKTVSKLDTSERRMFDFYLDTTDREPKYVTSCTSGIRLVHPFLTPCADPFIEDTRAHLPDEILDDYAKVGVNAFVIHAILSTISPYPFDPRLSKDYKLRRRNLQDLINRAGRRGIKVILYFNEPRAIPEDVFERYGRPELGGSVSGDGLVSLCLDKEENRKYLYGAVYDLFSDVKGIGGVELTTKSENRTSCTSVTNLGMLHYKCPTCYSLPIETNPVLANNIFARAIRDAGSDAVQIAALWAWNNEIIENGIPKLDDGIEVWSVSEWGLPISKGGVECNVIDYSISNPGPSEMTRRAFELAKKHGHKTMAKIQVGCSWELAVVPYLPVFDLELEHLVKLRGIGADDYQFTWTLGSCPSVTFDLLSSYLSNPDLFDLEKWYEKHYGNDAERVHEAVKMFCTGFKEYPFSVGVAYRSPKNLGVANRWSLGENKNPSCMVGWTFDDVEYYGRPYPPEILVAQFEHLIAYWELGCRILEGTADTPAAEELLLFSKVALNHFRAEVLHTRYVLAKRSLPESKNEMRYIFKRERELCLELLELLPKSTFIGFETSNHYFYTERDVIEKLVLLDGLTDELENI